MIPIGRYVQEARKNYTLFNHGGYVGLVWYLFNPLVLIVSFLFLKDVFNHAGTANYAAYLVVGILIFNFFRRATTQVFHVVRPKQVTEQTATENRTAIISSVTHTLFMHVWEVVVLAGILLYSGIPIWHLALYFIVLIVLCVATIGISFLLMSLRQIWDNTKPAWMAILHVLFLATPIFYTLPPGHIVARLNPLAHVLEAIRAVVLDGKLFTTDFAVVCLLSIVLFCVGYQFHAHHMRRYDRSAQQQRAN